MLSDVRIEEYLLDGRIVIDPYPSDRQIQPCSVDLRLGSKILKYKDSWTDISLDNPYSLRTYELDITDRIYSLKPGEFILASTEELIHIPDYIAARVEGKSSLGRMGLLVHVTAGFIDPGFKGNITLELKNLNNRPIQLRKGMLISQICFVELKDPVACPYGSPDLGSHYQDSKGTVGPRR